MQIKRSIWAFGGLLGVLFVILQLVEYKYVVRDISTSLLIGILAVIFLGLGIWLGLTLGKNKKSESADPNMIKVRLEQLNISPREYDVLGLMAKGCSNQEIANQLFISLSTVKTHTSNLYAKLDVKRRTQAIQKAQDLKLLD